MINNYLAEGGNNHPFFILDELRDDMIITLNNFLEDEPLEPNLIDNFVNNIIPNDVMLYYRNLLFWRPMTPPPE